MRDAIKVTGLLRLFIQTDSRYLTTTGVLNL
jgi:hypothetical protein